MKRRALSLRPATLSVIACLALVPALAACVVGPRYATPKIHVPEAYRESSPTEVPEIGSSFERWWTGFNDPILESLIVGAVRDNLDLKIAAARIREARAARGIAASAGKPRLSANAAYARTERSDAVPPFKSAPDVGSAFGNREQDVFEVGFDAGWEIDVFGGVRRDEEAALAQFQAAEENRRDVLVTLLADIARNYAELRGAQRQLGILDETVRSERDTLEIAGARFEAGLGTELDVARADGLLSATTAERPTLERLARQAIYRLGVLTGQDPEAVAPELETPGVIPVAPPDIPQTLPSELLSRRPDLRRAERELAAATARIGVAKADLFPRFSINGSFGRLSEDASDLGSGSSRFWILGPRLRWPILSGGRITANIHVQEARQEQALGQYEKAVQGALEEVENALSAHARERSRRESLRSSVESNRRALDLAMERYTSGLESFISVLDAQRSVYAAEDHLVQSQTREAVTLIALYKALGGGWSLDEDRPAPEAVAKAKRQAQPESMVTTREDAHESRAGRR